MNVTHALEIESGIAFVLSMQRTGSAAVPHHATPGTPLVDRVQAGDRAANVRAREVGQGTGRLLLHLEPRRSGLVVAVAVGWSRNARDPSVSEAAGARLLSSTKEGVQGAGVGVPERCSADMKRNPTL